MNMPYPCRINASLVGLSLLEGTNICADVQSVVKINPRIVTMLLRILFPFMLKLFGLGVLQMKD
jgi:hypothetical protein